MGLQESGTCEVCVSIFPTQRHFLVLQLDKISPPLNIEFYLDKTTSLSKLAIDFARVAKGTVHKGVENSRRK